MDLFKVKTHTKDFERFYEDYISFIKALEDRGYSANEIFTRHNRDNKNGFDALLGLVNKYPGLIEDYSGEGLKPELFGQLELMVDGKSRVLRSGDIKVGAKKKFETSYHNFKKDYKGVAFYLSTLRSAGFLTINNGNIGYSDTLVEPTDIKRIEELKNRTNFDLYEFVITKDGKVYFSLFEHAYMCRFLIGLGKDVKGALRVSQAPVGNRQMLLSSLINSADEESEFKEDNFIKVTDAQAKAVVSLISCLNKHKKLQRGNRIEDVLDYSSNLGYGVIGAGEKRIEDFNLKIAKWNYLQFEEFSGGEINASEKFKQVVEKYRLIQNQEERE